MYIQQQNQPNKDAGRPIQKISTESDLLDISYGMAYLPSATAP